MREAAFALLLLLFAVKHLFGSFIEATTSIKYEIRISKVSKACSCVLKQSLNSIMLPGSILPDLYPVLSTNPIYINCSLTCFKLPSFFFFNNGYTHCALLFLKLKIIYSLSSHCFAFYPCTTEIIF